MTESTTEKLALGISSCVLGEAVRFDGGHKRNRYIVGTLAEYFDFRPVCPEVAIGLGVPREPIQLRGPVGDVRVVGVKDPGRDVTRALADFGQRMAGELDDICGYILKSGSPSCGMERVKRFPPGSDQAVRDSTGRYASALMQANPLLPVEEEGRLNDPVLRENFFERVFVYRDWQVLTSGSPGMAELVDFHACHKYALMAHSTEDYRALGRLVANAEARPLDELLSAYGEALMACLARKASRKGNANVLQHIQGYLKNDISAGDKVELEHLIHEYRLARLPLIVPITMLKHHFGKYPNDYIARQTFLNPHPPELMLRNLV